MTLNGTITLYLKIKQQSPAKRQINDEWYKCEEFWKTMQYFISLLKHIYSENFKPCVLSVCDCKLYYLDIIIELLSCLLSLRL